MGIRSTNQARWVSQTSTFANNLGAEIGKPDGRAPNISATGGTKTTPGDGYVYHAFTSSGSFQVASGGGNTINYIS